MSSLSMFWVTIINYYASNYLCPSCMSLPGPKFTIQYLLNWRECWLFSPNSRHPQSTERPTFQRICELLQAPESSLLKWSVRERAVDTPNALKLGAQLKLGAKLHKDLQNVYKTSWYEIAAPFVIFLKKIVARITSWEYCRHGFLSVPWDLSAYGEK